MFAPYGALRRSPRGGAIAFGRPFAWTVHHDLDENARERGQVGDACGTPIESLGQFDAEHADETIVCVHGKRQHGRGEQRAVCAAQRLAPQAFALGAAARRPHPFPGHAWTTIRVSHQDDDRAGGSHFTREQQARIEASDRISFDEYLENYFSA